MKAEKPKLRDDFGNAPEIFHDYHEKVIDLEKQIKRLKEEKEYFISQNRLNSLEVIRLKKENEKLNSIRDGLHEQMDEMYDEEEHNQALQQALSDFKSQVQEKIEREIIELKSEYDLRQFEIKKGIIKVGVDLYSGELSARISEAKKILELLEEKI